MATIILAEDSFAISEAVTALLQSEFHSVLTVDNGGDALDLYWKIRPDLLILDVMLPVKNGFDVCRQIRVSDQMTPILFLSAKTSETDKVLGLGLGADDYLPKPFGSHEFLARVSALLRRSRVNLMASKADRKDSFRLGTAVVSGGELVLITTKGTKIAITKREFMLLKLLKAHHNEIVSKEEIMELLWGTSRLLKSRTLEQHLCNLRRKVKGNGFSITTVPRSGVRLELTKKGL